MKIAFDENIPIGMVRVFQTLARERQLRRAMGNFTIVSAAEYTPRPKDQDYVKGDDVPWLTRFARDGGKVVISGDRDMLDTPHERLALQQNGFVVIFFERRWSGWDFFRKSSLLLHYWRKVAKRVTTAKPGALLRIPANWKEDGDLLDVPTGEQKISKRATSDADQAVSSAGKGTGRRRKRSGVRAEATEDRQPEAVAAAPKDPAQGELNLTAPRPKAQPLVLGLQKITSRKF